MHRKIAVVGLGYVGLPVAVAFGKTHRVVGFDIKLRRIAELRLGNDITGEIGADELAAASISYTSDIEDLRGCDFFIVAVPTPVHAGNSPDLGPLLSASRSLGKILKRGDIVVYESTVYPGATEEECVPVLVAESGLAFGTDFTVGYSPERINPGDREHTFATIKKIVSGSDARTLDVVAEVYGSVVTAGVHLASTIKVAEAAKVIENTQRDLNIALVNELSIIFARLGIDTIDVLEAAGSKWNFLPFRPGLVGGHCIGVDPYYLTHKAEQVGYHPQVILAGRRINDNMARYVARNTIKLMLKNGMDVPRCRIGVLGITFKENCPDIRNSKVADMVREFQAWGATVVLADPWASAAEVAHEYDLQLGQFDAENQVDALVVAVGHNEYRNATPAELRALCRGSQPVLADVKSLFDRHEAAAAGFTVFRL
jgi:UDP-N-acetyl-D-galactosamine dehydrogenase